MATENYAHKICIEKTSTVKLYKTLNTLSVMKHGALLPATVCPKTLIIFDTFVCLYKSIHVRLGNL